MSDAPELPKDGLGVDLNPAGQGWAEAITNKVKEHDDLLTASGDEESPALGDLASKDTIERTDLAAGFGSIIIQNVEVDFETATTLLSTQIPADNTVPQIGEGDEVLSGTFTPLSATSTLIITARVFQSPSTGGGKSATALFINGAASAVAVGGQSGTNLFLYDIAVTYRMTPGSTDPITMSVRIGSSVGNTTINGTTSGDTYGLLLRSYLFVEEREAH